MNIKKIFGMFIALSAVLCIILALLVNALAAELKSIPLSASNGYKIASGSTIPGRTSWVVYPPNSIYVDINTRKAGFSETPLYFTSIGGDHSHFMTQGATSIYRPSPTGFRVYIYKGELKFSLTPDKANSLLWHINWMAIGK
ncbi:hypothetical protein CYANOKiyG1_39730 [Okeania sp. KiyG1]|nr:hypothetical protein CYANOKiyG1_39730 [Okeania sp. KiyG1]